MLGRNQSVRKTPVSSRTTKLHRAISPSMKDQWSGKTLRRFFFARPARPRRSSAQVAAAPALDGLDAFAAVVPLLEATPLLELIVVTLPEARTNRLREVAGCYQVPLLVHRQR